MIFFKWVVSFLNPTETKYSANSEHQTPDSLVGIRAQFNNQTFTGKTFNPALQPSLVVEMFPDGRSTKQRHKREENDPQFDLVSIRYWKKETARKFLYETNKTLYSKNFKQIPDGGNLFRISFVASRFISFVLKTGADSGGEGEEYPLLLMDSTPTDPKGLITK